MLKRKEKNEVVDKNMMDFIHLTCWWRIFFLNEKIRRNIKVIALSFVLKSD